MIKYKIADKGMARFFVDGKGGRHKGKRYSMTTIKKMKLVMETLYIKNVFGENFLVLLFCRLM